MKKIIIAGAGHGGLVAAAYLAQKGYDVTVFEQQKREDLGHDWHDTIKNRTFEYAGITDYDKNSYHLRKNATFYSPAMRTSISYDIPDYEQELEIDRKVLYKYLIDNALNKGAEILFENSVSAPLIYDGVVSGLIADNKEITADLVIDSAGIASPVINGLPKSYEMSPSYGRNDVFHTFRAYFEMVKGAEIINADRFNTYFKFDGLKGIAWFKVTDGMADVLVGSVEPLDMQRVNEVLEKLRKEQPSIGEKILRGGQIKHIPLKSTLLRLAGDNFAAVGDAASMPIPLNGSGITNAILAAKILSETIIEIDERGDVYSSKNLWSYQVKYFKEVAAQMASICVIKNCLLNYRPNAIDFLFDKKILTAEELSAGANGNEISMSKAVLFNKIKKGIKRPDVLLRLKGAVQRSKDAKLCAQAIPSNFEPQAVAEWQRSLKRYLEA